MKLNEDAQILEGLPVLHIRSLGAVVCSDLHLGYEGVAAQRGTFLPKVNLKNVKETLKKAVEMTGAERIIVDGDIKNEFSTVHPEEFNEFREFVRYASGELGVKKITLIKGNHDNFIDRIGNASGIEIYAQEALISEFLFFHGEELPRSKKGRLLVMGHIHPAVTLYNGLGIREKLRCFLYGRMRDGRKIVVIPAMNYFAQGVGINMEDVNRMAPVFRKMLDIDSMEALCIGEGETLDFGRVGELRRARD